MCHLTTILNTLSLVSSLLCIWARHGMMIHDSTQVFLKPLITVPAQKALCHFSTQIYEVAFLCVQFHMLGLIKELGCHHESRP